MELLYETNHYSTHSFNLYTTNAILYFIQILFIYWTTKEMNHWHLFLLFIFRCLYLINYSTLNRISLNLEIMIILATPFNNWWDDQLFSTEEHNLDIKNKWFSFKRIAHIYKIIYRWCITFVVQYSTELWL